MIATKRDVLAVAPCFSSLTENLWADAFRLAGAFLSDDAWGEPASRAAYPQALFVAHHLALAYPAVAVDAFLVSAETVGAVSRSYVVPTLDPGSLRLTKWGAQYLALVRALPSFFVV